MTAPAQLDACALHECFIYDGPLPRRPKGWRHNAGYQPGAIGRQTTVLSSRYGINLLCCEAWLNGHPECVALPHFYDDAPQSGEDLGSEPIIVLAVRIYDPRAAKGWSVALVAQRNYWTGVAFWTRDVANPAQNNHAASELIVRLAGGDPVQQLVLERVLIPYPASADLHYSHWQRHSAKRFASIMRRRPFRLK